MAKRGRVGRPAKKLAKPKALITRRVRHLLDLAHDGNIHEASRASGLPYATLRDLYQGTTVNPGIKTLEALANAFGTFAEWFVREDLSDEVPLGGVIGILPPLPEWEKSGRPKERWRYEREVMIPFAAWPLYKIRRELIEYLDDLPPSPERPIVGDAEDNREFNLRLTTFLLGPVLAAKEAGEARALVPRVAYVPEPIPTSADEERWVRTLKALGVMWEAVIPDLLQKARAHIAKKYPGRTFPRIDAVPKQAAGQE